ncbi:MAG TPA: MFS transporter [Acidobacteriota bacterium]|nr:MFS transporter [Acidobacteriota bacterium]
MSDQKSTISGPKPLPALRWWICGLLFISTVINYIDRQTLSVLGPYLKQDFHWKNEDFALIVISFRIAYAIGQILMGRLMDKVGTRRGLSLTVAWYSLAAMLTSFASGLYSFCGFRFLLGLGESANWPAATKAVAEWFPKKERGLAVGLFDSGSSIGGVIAPLLVVFLYLRFGWRPSFILIGTLGIFWILAWRRLYHAPETHPRLSERERKMILAEREQELPPDGSSAPKSWSSLLRMPTTWGVIVARSFSDPVWFFIADWFFIYLKQDKHIDPQHGLLAAWIPFLGADLGNLTGGAISSWLIRRGWPVDRARKIVILVGGFGVALLIPTIFTSSLFMVSLLFALATFSYAAYSTMALVLPSDLFPRELVASVSGMSGTGAGVCTIAATYVIGQVADRYSFAPILIAASLIPLTGAFITMALIRSRDRIHS